MVDGFNFSTQIQYRVHQEQGIKSLVPKLFALFKLFLSSLDIYVWEPLFWTLILLFLSGLEQISDVRKGTFYTSKKDKLISAVIMIIISIITFWYYWLRPRGIDKLISM